MPAAGAAALKLGTKPAPLFVLLVLAAQATMFKRLVRGVEEVYVWSNRDPWLTVRRVACEPLVPPAALGPPRACCTLPLALLSS